MKRIAIWLLGFSLICCPQAVLAAGSYLNFQLSRQNDGSIYSELHYNDRVLWRFLLLPDGARPAASGYNSAATLVVPDIIDGVFLLKMQ